MTILLTTLSFGPISQAWSIARLDKLRHQHSASLVEPKVWTRTEENRRPSSSLRSLNHQLQGQTRIVAVKDPLGPPPVVDSLQIHGEPLIITRNIPNDHNDKNNSMFQVHRLACNPPIFLLQNFLTIQECHQIMEITTMSPAETTEGDSQILRPNCNVAWVDNKCNTITTSNNLIGALGRDVGNLLLSDAVKTSTNAGCEPLQVLNYFEAGGEFALHHDGLGRVLTVIYYLNGVAGTWFPLADKQLVSTPQNRNQALHIAKECLPGRDGVLISGRNSPLLKQIQEDKAVVVVNAGDCIAFYNYNHDELNGDRVNWQSLHAGLPTTKQEGNKWIANHWMHAPALFRNVKTLFSTPCSG